MGEERWEKKERKKRKSLANEDLTNAATLILAVDCTAHRDQLTSKSEYHLMNCRMIGVAQQNLNTSALQLKCAIS